MLYGNSKPDTKQMTEEVKISDVTLAGMVKRRAQASKAHWEKKYRLSALRKENQKLYDTSYVEDMIIDDRYEDIFADNRLFTSVRTIVSFANNRLSQPEVTPSSKDPIALNFANDFEKILVKEAESIRGKEKVKLALQDLLKGRRLGALKFGYDPIDNRLTLTHIDPEDLIVDHTVKLWEEPNFVQECQERTIEQLISQFPDKKEDLFLKLGIDKGVPSQMELQKKITENRIKYVKDDKYQIIVVWMYDDLVLGKISDELWISVKGRKNILPCPLMPYIFFNMLNDGSGLIDSEAFIEQAKYNQRNYDKMGQRIVEDASYGGIGVPVFANGAIEQGDASKVRFSPVQRIILDTEDVGKAFTTWQSAQMPAFIPEEKYDSRNNIDNIFGTPNIFRGEQSKNQTLGQDVIIRDQAEGRQSEIIDAIDSAMTRFYNIEAQCIYRYYDEEKFYNILGEDGKFEHLVISQEKIASNVDINISIKAGTSMPIDKAQRRATVLKIASRLPTLTVYRELGIENPEETYKLYLLEQTDPKAALQDVEKEIYDEEAEEDLQLVIAGDMPDDRDDLTESYLNYLNEYLLTDKFAKLKLEEQSRVSQFVDEVIAKSQRKLDKLQTQVPLGGQPPANVPQTPENMTAGAPPIPSQASPPTAPMEQAPAPPMQPPMGMPPA